ncbi:MAG: SDR family oxidoreductase [Vicinamibacteria bacterium]|jgi:NAD(P)-dependent dehydrogenase (short-subunit alcohol dehydrogenase family)|nr:SDR family oxidoreductase [Vicinamibacteria bacterium]
MDEARYQGKLAVVTGGGSGLGRELVRALAKEGADVAFSYCSSRQAAEEEAALLQKMGRRAATFHADARQVGAMSRFVEQAASFLGGVDLLINNIGVFRKAGWEEIREDLLDEAFAVNVRAAVMTSQAGAAHMRKRGGGAILNIASLGGLKPWRSYLPYCATKAALIMATECLAMALAPDIRVNALAPGILEKPTETSAQNIPLGRLGRTDEAVATALFLLSSATYTTGDVWRVDGGKGRA